MDKIKLTHQENYNGWIVECNSLPDHVKSKLEGDLAEYSSDYYDEDEEYEGGMDFNNLKNIISQYSSDFKLSLNIDSVST